jgi:hypothetical protein
MPPADAMRQAERMRGFLEDVEGLARSAPPGRWPRLGQIEGTDPSGTVSFVIDDQGAFVTVYLAPEWSENDDGLPSALKAAQRNALDKLNVARLTFRRLLGPSPAPPASDDGFRPRYGLSRTTDYEELLGSWRTMTAESYQRFYEYERRGAGGPVEVSGPAGLVRLTVDNGVITDVRLPVGGVTSERLAEDIRAALHEAGGHHG